MVIVYLALLLTGSWLVITGIVALGSVVLSVLAAPIALLGDLGSWMKGTRMKDSMRREREKLDEAERTLNAYFERKYFGTTPESGTLDENGIPFL